MLPTARLAHPRSRGENVIDSCPLTSRTGSSPLALGKHAGRNAADARQRLIPTHARKTFPLPSCAHSGGPHPRSRGENCTRAAKLPVITGSSPLTRGKHHGTDSRRPRRRLIPTHARKTWGKRCGASRKRAHPRRPGKTDLY